MIETAIFTGLHARFGYLKIEFLDTLDPVTQREWKEILPWFISWLTVEI